VVDEDAQGRQGRLADLCGIGAAGNGREARGKVRVGLGLLEVCLGLFPRAIFLELRVRQQLGERFYDRRHGVAVWGGE